MNLNEGVELTLEEMVKMHLRTCETDPIFLQQFPKYFYLYKKSEKAGKEQVPEIPGKAKRFLESRRISRGHQIEANFNPYFKAHHITDKLSKQQKPKKDFDLADENQKLFTDTKLSLNKLIRSTSPICASRLPSSPMNQPRPYTGQVPVKSRSNSLAKPEVTPMRCFIFSSRRNRSKSDKKSLLSTYKGFKLNSLIYSYNYLFK